MFIAGLPDGIFSYFEGPTMDDAGLFCGVFCGHFGYFMVIWYISPCFGPVLLRKIWQPWCFGKCARNGSWVPEAWAGPGAGGCRVGAPHWPR
jgi:hypothetical protein